MDINKKIKVKWDLNAKNDLKTIFDFYKLISNEVALNLIKNIVSQSKSIHFVEQYQTDELLGEPFRRMVVSHYKIIYKIQSETEIRILQIFDSRQDQSKLRNIHT